ncbi:MAG TPA: CARDB domain-containing protein [Thermoanaerobaculia bacterium]|nr:CARDB domain-containing protein [Thermoanaerobaculia bacterium]
MRPSHTLRLVALLFVFITVSAHAEDKRADEMPALAAKSIAVTPAHPEPEEAAVVVLTIENSSAPVENVEVVFYANGEALASRIVNLDTGRATVSVPWMPKSVGKTTLVATVDPRQLLIETNRFDNTHARDVITSIAPAVDADFALTGMDMLAPADGPGRIRVIAGNEGSISASAPLVIRRNGEAAIVVDTGVIEAGKSTTLEVPWSDPERGAISAEVNPRWSSREPSSKNNTLAASAGTEGVDLRIEQLAFHTLQYEEDRTRRIGVHFRIVNDGAQSVTKPFRTRIDPGAVDKDGKLVPAYVSTDALPAGGTVYVSHIFESAPGEFALTADADVDNSVAEADEKNNTAAKEYHNPAPDPDRWVNIGPRRVIDTGRWYGWSSSTGRLSTLAIDPTAPSTMYVGAQLSGVWKTVDGGANWISLAESATVRVAALALEPGNPSRVFLVTPSDGVLRSDNAGTSWTQISDDNLAAVIHAGGGLLINPAAPNQMVVSSDDGIYRSEDGGVSWILVLSGGACKNLMRRAHNGALYATLFHKTDPGPAGVYESFNWGANWRLVRGCPGGALPSGDANTLIRVAASGWQQYVGYTLGDTFRLFRPGNLGCSIGGEGDSFWDCIWAPDSDPSKHIWSGLYADPSNANKLFATGTYMYRSTNGGSDFSTISGLTASGSAHSDHHQLVFHPTVPSTVFTLTDGGIYRSTNGGGSGSWVHIGDGITNVEFYDGAVAPTDASLLIGGTQDNGNLKGTAGNAVWSEIRGGDGATVDFDPTNSSIMYTMAQRANSIQRSTNGGAGFSPAANGLPTGTQCDNLHFQVHPSRPATLVASCGLLYRTTNSGSNWSILFGPLTNVIVRSAIDGPADIYYAGSNSGEIFVGPGGASWRTIFEHPSDFPLTDLELDLADPSRLYASFDSRGVQEGRIVRLVRNPATGNFTAQDITGDLPLNRLVQTIAIDKNRPSTLYVGTERGVFQGRSTEHGMKWFWRPYNNGLPLADVRDLEVHPVTGIMRAFTHGRSAFEVTTSKGTGGGDEVND